MTRPDRPPPASWLVAVVVVAVLGVVAPACAGDPGASPTQLTARSTAPATSSTMTAPPAWADIDRDLSALGPAVGFLAAEVTPQGTCRAIHEIAATTPRPTGSQFKLWVLGALTDAIASGRLSWDQPLTVDDAHKSAGNGEGSLQAVAPGTTVTVEEAATKMISISDNTAADMLIELVGRDAVVAQARAWTDRAGADDPLLTTREMLLLHYVPGLGDAYLATPKDQRSAFLAASVDPRPLTDIGLGLSADPRFIDTIEWFASPADICRSFAGLHQLAMPAAAPLATVMSREVGGIGLDGASWPTVWFKGGSEPGVLTLGWLASDDRGNTYVVQAMISDADAALEPGAIEALVGIGRRSFERLR